MDDCFEKTALFWQQLHAKIWAAIRSGSPKTILTTQRYFGTANWNQYGIPASSRNVVRNAFNETARDIPQESSRQNNSRGSSRTYNDELYDSLLRAGAAITEQDALGESGFSFSENATTITKQDVDAIQSIGRKSVNDFNSAEVLKTEAFARRYWRELGTKSPFFRSWFGDWRSNDTSDVRVVRIEKTNQYKAGKTVNLDTGRTISWGNTLRSETWAHGNRRSFENIRCIEGIIQNAVLLDTFVSDPKSKSKLPMTAFMHSLYSIADDGGKIIIYRLFAEEAVPLSGGEPFTRAFELKEIKEVASMPYGVLSENGGLTNGASATNWNVADLFDFVKKNVADFHPKPVHPSILRQDGSPILLYHYTDAEFDSFDVGRSGSNQGDRLGDGIYLSSSPTAFESYGKNRLDMYASIQNPFEMQLSEEQANFVLDRYAATKHDLDAFDGLYREHAMSKLTNPLRVMDYLKEYAKDNKIKVSDILKSLGYDGVHDGNEWVAFDSTQVKSATDNIGTFDGRNSNFNFSENAPTTRQSRLNEAWELFDNNSTPATYYESNPRGFDVKTNNLLRGLMLRNGEDVGGALSDATMERIAGIFEGATRRNALSLSLSSPVRVFEDVTGWGGRTAEERAKNVRNGNLLKNTYYEYGNLQAANRETWIAENMRPVIEATTKQNPVNSCPDGRGAAGAARRIRLRREGLSRLLCRRCK